MKRAAFLLAVAIATPAFAQFEFDDAPAPRPVVVKRAPVERLAPLVVRPLPVPAPVVIDPPAPAKVAVPEPKPEPKPVPAGLKELPPDLTCSNYSIKFDLAKQMGLVMQHFATARAETQTSGTGETAQYHYKLVWLEGVKSSNALDVLLYKQCLERSPKRTKDQQVWLDLWKELQTYHKP